MRKRFDSFQRGLRPAKARSSFVTPPVRSSRPASHFRRSSSSTDSRSFPRHLGDARGQRHRDLAVVSPQPTLGLGQARAERLSQGDRPYWSLAFAGIAFSQIGAFTARDIVRSHQWSHLANTALVSFTNLVCFAIFWVLKLVVFNKIFHFDKLKVIDEELVAEELSAIPDATIDPIWND